LADLHRVPNPTQPAKLIDDESRHRSVLAARHFDSEILQFAHGQTSRQEHRSILISTYLDHITIELVVNLPNELLDEILNGHNACRSTELVDDQSHLTPMTLKAPKDIKDPR
jgi:hypothetical protein